MGAREEWWLCVLIFDAAFRGDSAAFFYEDMVMAVHPNTTGNLDLLMMELEGCRKEMRSRLINLDRLVVLVMAVGLVNVGLVGIALSLISR